jgi:hypothetical protein
VRDALVQHGGQALAFAGARGAQRTRSSSDGPAAAPRHHCNAWSTDSGAAFGNQPCTIDSTCASRISASGLGCGRAPPASRAPTMRSSTLPRLTCPATRSRSAGSRARNSSGSFSERSRKRPFSERTSALTTACVDAVSSARKAAPILALAYPVML